MRYWLYGNKNSISVLYSGLAYVGKLRTNSIPTIRVYISALRKSLAHIPGLGKNSLPTWIFFALTNPNANHFSSKSPSHSGKLFSVSGMNSCFAKASYTEYWDWFPANRSIRAGTYTQCLTHVLKSYQMTHQPRGGLKLTMRRIAQTQTSPRLRVVKESLEFLLDPWSKYTLATRRRPGNRLPNWAWNMSLALQESL